MRTVTIIRTTESDEGTFGHLVTGDFHCRTGELPWRNNAVGISRIPAGEYTAFYRNDGSKGPCYQLLNVPGRTAIQIHVGNWCGDKRKRLLSDVEGCILIGMRVGPLNNQRAVVSSGVAFQALHTELKAERIRLLIEDRFDDPPLQAA